MRWLIVATAVVIVGDWVPTGHQGLNATYYSGLQWQSGREQTRVVDSAPSTETLKRRRPDFAEHPFSVEWRGFIEVRRAGRFRFVVKSDDGAAVYVRGKLVVDHPGRHALTPPAEGEVTLDAGVHAVFIRYFQDGEGCGFEADWARNGSALEPVPPSAWLTEEPSEAWQVARQVNAAALTLVSLAWLGIALLTVAMWVFRLCRRHLAMPGGGANPALGAVLGISTLLNVCGIWWALPNLRGWGQDELVPIDVLEAVSQRFAHGWSGKYPPLHYAVLSLADSPLLVLSWLGHLDLEAPGPYLALFVIGRLVGLMFAAGVVAAVYLCGRELYGETGAVFAALTTALMAPFVYYGKLTNLEAPYLFWFALSLLAYIRILKHHRRADYLLFATCAALAVCTKDQAYGLVVGASLAIVVARWRRWQVEGGPLLQIVIDRTTILATGVAVAVFAVGDNIVLNYGGFVQHVKTLLGPASTDYQMFPGTVAGQLRMAALALLEFRYIFGWPLVLFVIVALVWGCARARTHLSLLWLLVPPLCYYATFSGVVLYFYDRFLLPMGLVLALFVGGWLEQFVASGRRWRIGLIATAFAYSVLYASVIDYAMVNDSRYEVTRWVRERADADDVVASHGPLEYFMLADGLAASSAQSFENIMAVRPAFIVLNSDTATLAPTDPLRKVHERLRNGEGQYRLGFRYRTRPWSLPGGHPDVSGVPRRFALSSLGMINPSIEVFVRADVGDRPTVGH